MSNAEFSCLSFNDIDCYRQFFAGQGWDLESTQLSRGTTRIRYDHIALPELLVSDHRVKRSTLDVFEIPVSHIVLSIGRRTNGAVLVDGVHLPPEMLAIVRPVGTYHVRIPDDFDAVEFTISERFVERTGLFPARYYQRVLQRRRHGVLPLLQPLTDRFLSGVDRWFQVLRSNDELAQSSDCMAEFEEFVIDGLQRLIDAGISAGPGELPRHARRTDLVQQARSLVRENLTSQMSADEMAQTLGVSRRVLSHAFQDVLGMGPYQYALTERLHSARQQLSTGAASVTDACFSHGFSTPSRFARQYHRLFGELPSQTLRRNGRLIRR